MILNFNIRTLIKLSNINKKAKFIGLDIEKND